MFDIGLFFIFQNIFILMLIFWGLSWLGDRFYKQRNYKASECIYECGFSSTHALRVSINFGFFLIAALLILYDVEFFLLVPVYFNFFVSSPTQLIVYWVFLLFITLSFALDWSTISMRWLQ